MVKRVEFIEPIIEAPVDSELMLECMTFKDEQGHEQLLCILEGQSNSFKISCHDDGTCEIAKRKIRFIGQNFFAQIQEICIETQTSKLHKLCSLLQNEITEGRVIFEQKKKNGKRHVIATPTIAERIQDGSMPIKNKKGKTLRYSKVNSAGDSFFKHMAKSFGASIQSALQYHEHFSRTSEIEKTSPEGKRLEQEAKIAAKTQNSGTIWDIFHSIKDAFFKLFASNDDALKAQEKLYVLERAQSAQRRALDEEQKSREKDNDRFEARRDERKRDDARYERSRDDTKRAQAKQDARIFGK